jgi:small subunit ribosomal protein S10e
MTSATTQTRADPRSISPLNPQVIKLMQSFTSKELVKEQFSWRYYYWYLTNEGIEYLREYLNLSADVVPNTLKKSTRPPTRPMADERAPRGDRGPRGGREGYRSERPGGFGRGGDKAGPGGNFNPQFA